MLYGRNGNPSQKLGEGAVLGDETWDQHSRVRIKLGPMSLRSNIDFSPQRFGL